MQCLPPPRQELAEKLRDRIGLSLVPDDIASERLRAAEAFGAGGDHEAADASIEALRRHRLCAIKHRAPIWANGPTIR